MAHGFPRSADSKVAMAWKDGGRLCQRNAAYVMTAGEQRGRTSQRRRARDRISSPGHILVTHRDIDKVCFTHLLGVSEANQINDNHLYARSENCKFNMKMGNEQNIIILFCSSPFPLSES